MTNNQRTFIEIVAVVLTVIFLLMLFAENKKIDEYNEKQSQEQNQQIQECYDKTADLNYCLENFND